MNEVNEKTYYIVLMRQKVQHRGDRKMLYIKCTIKVLHLKEKYKRLLAYSTPPPHHLSSPPTLNTQTNTTLVS